MFLDKITNQIRPFLAHRIMIQLAKANPNKFLKHSFQNLALVKYQAVLKLMKMKNKIKPLNMKQCHVLLLHIALLDNKQPYLMQFIMKHH